jgi:hypothetical protein
MSETKQFVARLWFPLSKNQLAKLIEGAAIIKNYSLNLPPRMLMVVVWNRAKLTTLNKNAFDNPRKAGVDVANIPIDADDLDKIVNGEGLSAFFANRTAEVVVLTQKTFDELQKKANKHAAPNS